MIAGMGVVLITGGARRLGRAMAEAFAGRGDKLIITYRHSAEEAQGLAESLNGQALACDLSDTTQIQALADALPAGVDVLVNNASDFAPAPLGEISEAHWQRMLDSNATGPLFLTQAVAPRLRAARGCVINLLDIHVERPRPHYTPYLMAKNALAAMTRGLALEMAPQVRVNGIAPGAILLPEGEESAEALLPHIPLGRLGQPSDIAQAALYLADAPYVTGEIINVDGGRLLS